ncbi:uncharacterized protein LOC143198917 [Rhynchophorus ferrugineus]|uniref:uncharacterized protein LOC143198917 n=1 Tax=Rhynchophorus ferrugineus TaxID=354439 RepID=UPI003FCD8FD5
MEFFGLTSYGFSAPIKDMLRDDYTEPENPVSNKFVKMGKDEHSFTEKMKELDCYLGEVDGFAYRSSDRLTRMRRKYLFKPVGPCDMYRYPGVNSMKYGWWNNDPDIRNLSASDNWFMPKRFNITTSEMSRFVNHCLKVDKSFKL